jgi:membrane-associated phospholipid phosphatase
MAIVLTAVLFVGGWRGLALVAGFLLLEQYGAESTKAIFKRPRPSPDLISTFGSFSGYTFPSTTITFLSVTFGALGILALVRKDAPMRQPVMWISFLIVLAGCVARVALGAHWPSDVVLTALICMVWIWAASRIVLGKA